MEYPVWPRVKEFSPLGGRLTLEGLRVFSVGENHLFFTVLEAFFPEMTEKVPYDAATVRISQSASYSPYPEFCSLRIREQGVEIHCRDAAGARNAAAILANHIWKFPYISDTDCATGTKENKSQTAA